jgi:hypothetical protein
MESAVVALAPRSTFFKDGCGSAWTLKGNFANKCWRNGAVNPETFELLSPLRNIQSIANGRGIRIRDNLVERYGGRNWRKMKGEALVRDSRGTIYEAEIQWYEAHGVGRVDWKIKQPLH